MKRPVLALIMALGFFGIACKPPAPEKHYALRGEVISTNAERKTILVKHGEIAGLMPAMTMDYMVADPAQLEKLRPGDEISADLVVSESKGRLEKITLVEKAKPDSPAPTAGQNKTP